ncbi:glycoside hydrolase family 5 protein [Serendipita vermifera MAFF 305830]|uniref:glucan 1,3-beta-glucosidase n=1 Tax=Serendipita vermifera MAFF 305830 TaxID=933852 RepID=A0A0C3B6T5_SERVB|nr:glycoside hydrolase family 5 protein [Serendipita vermifera MAFF 305830]
MSQNRVPYDPLLDSPYGSNSNLNAGNTDFGAPAPHFVGTAYTTSTFGASEPPSAHGSVSALRDNNGGYAYPPKLAGGAPYRDDFANSTRELNEKNDFYEPPRKKTKKKGVFWALGCCALLIIAAAVIVPVYFFVIKPKTGSSSSSGSTGSSNGNGGSSTNGGNGQTVITTGGDGSTVTKADGTTFKYNNTFGGYWVYDVNNPLNNSARAQSWSPPLSEQWQFGVDRIYGVNLGGWLNLEPFISPALYEPFYPLAVDEWTLCEQLMARDGNLDAIVNHYETFITEEDFAQIAAAGLNWVRIPIAFWAIEVYPGEPYLPKTSWTYFLKAVEWARKYGIRINLDLHAVPGSQNGWNHSGKLGDINFLRGVMGVANAQRTLDYIRIIAEFISQPEYRDVIPFFGILNEPQAHSFDTTLPDVIPRETFRSFYAEAYKIIRTAGGSGQGNGPVMSIHDGYFGLTDWVGFLDGADRLALDTHPYLVFGTVTAGEPAAFATAPCERWSADFGTSASSFGITAAGEWSYAINDCGLYVNAVGKGTRYEGTYAEGLPNLGSCGRWNDYTTWDATVKAGLQQVSASTMDSLGDWFFWTWRIGESSATGKVEAPFWSYKLSIQEGWAVTDPRTSVGQCQRLGSVVNAFYTNGGALSSAQVGQGVTDAIGGVASLGTHPWPPTEVGLFANAALLPTYTATGPIPTLPVPSQPSGTPAPTATTNYGSGWANPADTELMHVPINGCAYPNAWNATTADIPSC